MIFHLISRISHFDDPSPFLFGRQKRTETKSTGDEDDDSVDASMSGDSNENSFPAANPPRAIVPVLVEVAAQTRHPRCLRILERIFKNELCFKQIIDMDLPGRVELTSDMTKMPEFPPSVGIKTDIVRRFSFLRFCNY